MAPIRRLRDRDGYVVRIPGRAVLPPRRPRLPHQPAQRLPGDGDDLAFLRAWSPRYREESWRAGLRRAGMDAAIGESLDVAFRHALRERCPAYDDALPALEVLSERYTMAVVTNGPADVQHTKLAASGLARFFPVVVASSEIGSGKPEPAIFSAALGRLGIAAGDALSVGDNLEKDCAGARAAGLRCIWINRAGAARSGVVMPDAEIATLAELPELLGDKVAQRCGDAVVLARSIGARLDAREAKGQVRGPRPGPVRMRRDDPILE